MPTRGSPRRWRRRLRALPARRVVHGGRFQEWVRSEGRGLPSDNPGRVDGIYPSGGVRMMLMFPERGRQLAAASVRGCVDEPPSYVFPDGGISLLPGGNIRRIAALAKWWRSRKRWFMLGLSRADERFWSQTGFEKRGDRGSRGLPGAFSTPGAKITSSSGGYRRSDSCSPGPTCWKGGTRLRARS